MGFNLKIRDFLPPELQPLQPIQPLQIHVAVAPREVFETGHLTEAQLAAQHVRVVYVAHDGRPTSVKRLALLPSFQRICLG